MEHVVELIADITDGFVVVLLTGGMIYAVARAVTSFLKADRGDAPVRLPDLFRQLRFDLGHILLLALEILIISDILHSIVRRTFEEIGILAITVAIRIALSFFLDRELTGIERQMNHQRDR
jgi:uncharacterized membrane protein